MGKILGTVGILVFMRNSPALQLVSLITLSTLMQAYQLSLRPISDPAQSSLAVFNESLITLYLLSLMTLTDANETPTLRDLASFFLIGLVFLSILANTGLLVFTLLRLVWKKISNRFPPRAQIYQKENTPTKSTAKVAIEVSPSLLPSVKEEEGKN
jgi:RsiW-degrading membrane proteinase PrsW (M82 family)